MTHITLDEAALSLISIQMGVTDQQQDALIAQAREALRISGLEQRITELEKALEPFAQMADEEPMEGEENNALLLDVSGYGNLDIRTSQYATQDSLHHAAEMLRRDREGP